MVEEFANSIADNRVPLTDGIAGSKVVQVLEALSKSLYNDGRPEDIVNQFFAQSGSKKTA